MKSKDLDTRRGGAIEEINRKMKVKTGGMFMATERVVEQSTKSAKEKYSLTEGSKIGKDVLQSLKEDANFKVIDNGKTVRIKERLLG